MKRFLLLFFLIELSCVNLKKPIPEKLVTKKTTIDVLITLSYEKDQKLKDNIKENLLKQDLKSTLIKHSALYSKVISYNFIKTPSEKRSPLLLEIDLSGYGKIKRQWVSFLFKMGLLEAVSQGVIVYTATGNTVLSLGVAGEEVVSEYLTWYGGSYLFGSIFEPVTLEGRLIDTEDGKILWRRFVVVTRDKKKYKKLSKKQKKNKEIVLNINYQKAKAELFSKWNRYLKANFPH